MECLAVAVADIFEDESLAVDQVFYLIPDDNEWLNTIQEKTIKLRDIIINSAILCARTKFRSLPEHFSSILCMRVRSKERTLFRAPPNRLSDSFRLRL